ncbi:hypothetical protein KSS87_011872 [Heliosperma pusillum]|nr:hypothetical protein KSS87_008786 [Heliosperma pusillum]KAH9617302.1 hypothetical protein KSS87_011872 [Heliosperma pusillum]
MEFFKRAKVFRLKCGHHNKYLVVDKDDENMVKQSSRGSSTNAHWSIEPVEGKTGVVRFRSCHTFKYLAITDDAFLTGMTGKRVTQRLRLDPTVEWEPVKEGPYVKLKSPTGTLLRANTWVPPWTNSVTHDSPTNWTGSEKMVLWIVDIVELDYNSNRGNKDAAHQVNASPSADISPSLSSVKDDTHNLPKISNTTSKLKPEKSGLEDKLGPTERINSNSDRLSRLPSAESMSRLAVNVAKITVKELKNVEFHDVLSSGQLNKLEKAVGVITADAKISHQGNKDLAKLEDRLKDITKDHKRAAQELVDFTTFSTKRYELRADVKQEVAKARQLEAVEAELKTTLTAAKTRREELLKQLQETENSIESAEKSQAESQSEIGELISRIQEKSEEFKVMESEQKSWQEKKYEAERTLEEVKEDWLNAKYIISDFC